MALSNYGELKSSIAGWLNRDDLTSVIPDFITLAEKRLSDDFRVRQVETQTDLTATGSSYAEVPLPSDYLEARVVRYTTSNPTVTLSYLTPSSFYQTHTTQAAGNPANYTFVGSNLLLGPVPAAGSIVQMTYYAKPTPMSNDTDANAWLTNFPDAVLYGALLEAAPYLGEDPRIQTWQFMYDRAKDQIKQANDRAQYNGAALQVRVLNENP